MDLDTRLKCYERFGIHLGLDRIQQLLASLDSPHLKVPVVHVAGTNGKGSVCAYLSAILGAAGYRVGRYTSPHLVDWTERICVDERPITTADLERSLLAVEAAIQPDGCSPTQFEVLTAAAWWYFAQTQVDVAVVEVGLGGRLDATNVCDRPLVTVITSIGRDHWQRLGPTLADIAREKSGILKPGCPAVVGPLPDPAKQVVEHTLAALDCPVIWPQPARWIPPDTKGAIVNEAIVNGTTASAIQTLPWAQAEGIPYPLPLLGDIQLTNSAVAIAVIQQLRQQGWPIDDTAITQGMVKTQWPGRLQWTQWNDSALLIDGAHNVAAAQALRHYIDRLSSQSVHWLMGMLSTKDHRDILAALLRSGDCLSLVPVPDHSSADPQELAQLAQTVCPDLTICQIYPNLEAGLASLSGGEKTIKVLCGSLYLIGEFLGTYLNN